VATSNTVPDDAGLWRGTTAEERLAPRRRKLMQAGFELLGEGGSEGTTVRGVCARAKLNPRYFYESFPDLDALVAAVFDEVQEESTRLTLAAIADADDTVEAKTRAGLEVGIRHIAGDPRRLRIVYGEGDTGVLVRKRAELVAQTAGLMAELAVRFSRNPREDKLLSTSTFMLSGGLFELIVAWSNGRIDLTIDELIDHATLLVVATSRAARARAS
jgi:AcrR family transcriptional regulator